MEKKVYIFIFMYFYPKPRLNLGQKLLNRTRFIILINPEKQGQIYINRDIIKFFVCMKLCVSRCRLLPATSKAKSFTKYEPQTDRLTEWFIELQFAAKNARCF